MLRLRQGVLNIRRAAFKGIIGNHKHFYHAIVVQMRNFRPLIYCFAFAGVRIHQIFVIILQFQLLSIWR